MIVVDTFNVNGIGADMENSTLQNNPLLLQLAMWYAIEYWQLVAKIQTAAAGAMVKLKSEDPEEWRPIVEWHEKLDAQLLSLEAALDEVCAEHGLDPAAMRKIAGTQFYKNSRPDLPGADFFVTRDEDYFAEVRADFSAYLGDAATYTNARLVSAAEFNLLRDTSRDTQLIMARAGAVAHHAADPRQGEKTITFEWWQDWQKHPDKYPSKAAFARDMLKNHDHLKSQKKIEDWCRAWEKAHPAG